MGFAAVCTLACFLAPNLTISTDIANEFVELEGT